LHEIKSKAGKGFPVQYRFGLKHYMKGLNKGVLPNEAHIEAGRDIEEGLQMAKIFEHSGFDALHVDAGCYDSHYWPHPPTYQKDGCMVDMAAEVKKAVKIPVIAVGKLSKPETAENIIATNKADIIALGRGLLADANWMRKVEQGRPEVIRPCIGCFDGCLGRISLGRPLSCAVNPSVGREATYALKKTNHRKKVLIVGGGVAGMEAARIAAIRGHSVKLYEKADRLGGCLVPASVPSFKKDVGALLRWYTKTMKDLGITIFVEHEVTQQFIETENTDVVIIANGAKSIIPIAYGIGNKLLCTAAEVLMGVKPVGERVVVVGGGLIGCETALWLAQQKKQVTIIEMFSDLMVGTPMVPKVTKEMMLDLLNYHRIDIVMNRKLTEVRDDFALASAPSGEKETYQADSVVLAMGLMADRELYQSVVGRVPGLYVIGDAREARNIMGAIWDAYEVGRSI
jgi:2-enoate reductase